jgi:ornithine carbamoyltransferase
MATSNDTAKMRQAFEKMLAGTRVEFADHAKAEAKKSADCLYTRFWYIMSVNENGTVDLCSGKHYLFSNWPIDTLKL